jgi:hypothetical protein
MTTDFPTSTHINEATSVISSEEVKQLTDAIKQIYANHGYRSIAANEFDDECSYEDFVAARRQGKQPTKVIHGNFAPSEEQTLAAYFRSTKP